jgi:hypothetical protein
MNGTLFGVLVAVVVLGVLLFLWGKRGRRLNNHPQCRDCGFDLDGVYPATITCPECGSGLRRPKAVRDGVRRRMGWLMAVGVLLALLPMAPLFTLLYAGATGTNLTKYTPTGLLLWQTRVASPALNKQIADELIDRMLKKQLDKGQSTAVAERVLAIQADRASTWDEVWGDVIERLSLNGDLTKDQLERFRRQSIALSGHCRAAVRAGDPLSIVIKQDSGRVGASSQMLAMAAVDSAKLGDITLKRAPTPSAGGLFGGGYGTRGEMFFYLYGSKMNTGWNMTMPQEQVVTMTVPKGTEPGVRTLTATVLCRVGDQQAGWNMSKMKAGDPGVASFTVTQTVNVVAPDAEPIKSLTPTPQQEKEMTALLKQAQVTANVSASSSPLPFFGGVSVSRVVMLQLQFDKPPTPFAFDAFVRIRDKETPLGSLTSSPAGPGMMRGMYMGGASGQNLWLSADVPNLQRGDQKVDLIFRPSVKAALGTVDISEIYGKEIVLKNVTVTRNSAVETVTGTTTTTTTEPETSPEPKDGDK